MESVELDSKRAKQIVEMKLQEKDVKGAIIFAKKVQSLFSELKRLFQFLGNLVVHVSREGEEIDWYTVLGVNPCADSKTLKQSYVKLAKSGLDSLEAYKILDKAWGILSNKFEREAYDLRRRLRAMQYNASIVGHATSANENVSKASFNVDNAVLSYQKRLRNNCNTGARDQRSGPWPPNTFWSGKINTQHRLYNALREYGSDQTVVSSSVKVPSVQVISPCRNSQASYDAPPPTNTFWSEEMNIHPGMHNVSGEHGSSQTAASSAKELIKPSRVNLKRGYEEGDQMSATRGKAPCIYSRKSGIGLPYVAESIGNEAVKHKKRKSSVYNIHDSSKNVPQSDMTAASGVDGQKGVYQCDMGNYREKINMSGSSKSNSSKKLPVLDTTSLLVRRAKTEIINKEDEWIAAAREKNECSAIHSIENTTVKDSGHDGLMTMEVPDSDFHEFDKDRTLTSFGENQVWAVYDDDDGMPRLYAVVHKVLSKRQFKLQINWLNSKNNKELGPSNWIDFGFHKTCGEFWVGEKHINDMLNSFSHRVLGWTKSARVYQIFPKKGDVWALYRNWSPNWNEHTTKEEKHKYDMVEVLEDYNEEKGVTIVPLVKAAGFKCVFYQPLDAKEVRTIPKEEIFRFSHQVMSYLLSDQEAPNLPRGSKELDPAAMPSELLQVIN